MDSAYNAWLKGWEEIDFETVSNVAVGEIQRKRSIGGTLVDLPIFLDN